MVCTKLFLRAEKPAVATGEHDAKLGLRVMWTPCDGVTGSDSRTRAPHPRALTAQPGDLRPINCTCCASLPTLLADPRAPSTCCCRVTRRSGLPPLWPAESMVAGGGC